MATQFQSTLPIREETFCPSSSLPANPFQSPLPIREETTGWGRPSCAAAYFNPLSPHEERRSRVDYLYSVCEFQSTLPARRETGETGEVADLLKISIHSPHTGRDCDDLLAGGPEELYFNPLFPYGKRPVAVLRAGRLRSFQSTLPIREETAIIRPRSRSI